MWVDRTAPAWKAKNQRKELAVGVVRTKPIAENDFQLNGSTRIGVHPLGAHVARIGGLCEKPDSSRKAIQALNRWAFF